MKRKFKKSRKKKEKPKTLEKLFLEGVNITKNTNLVNDCGELSELRRRYVSWVYDIRYFLEEHKIDYKIKSFFYENDTVFSSLDRGAGVYIEDEFAQKLLEDIEKETKKKLEHLKEVEPGPLNVGKDKKTPSLSLPTGTTWKDIEIKFKNEFDVEILVKGKFHKTTSYEDLGFHKSGTKTKEPEEQWDFLVLLSVIQSIKEEEATIEKLALSLGKKLNRRISKIACEKIKSNLSKRLQKTFEINDDPFYSYKDYGFYKTIFKLKPIPTLRGSGEPFMTKTGYNDNREYPEID